MFFSPSQKNKTFTLLDIGTSKITCCIVHCKEGTEAQVIGFSCVAAQGICNGAIVQLDKATECISFALKEAEKNAHNYCIEEVIVNISSSQLKSIQHHIELTLDQNIPISNKTIKDGIDTILSNINQEEVEIIQAIPLNFLIDKEKSFDPIGLYGHHFEIFLHTISIPRSQSQNLLTVLDRCHVSISEKVATPYASCLSVLNEEEKKTECVMIDFGAGATQIVHFKENSFSTLISIPIGGNQISQLIAKTFNCSLSNAEKIKLSYGTLFEFSQDSQEHFFIPQLTEDNTEIQISKSELSALLKLAFQEIISDIEEVLKNNNINSNYWILTGGGSNIEGLKEVLTSKYNKSVRIATPPRLIGFPNKLDLKSFSSCIGLLRYAIIKQEEKTILDSSTKSNFLKRIQEWFT